MSSYTLQELLEQPVVVKLSSTSEEDEFIRVKCEGTERKKFMQMSIKETVNYLLEHYEKNKVSLRVRQFIQSTIQQLDGREVYQIFDQLVDSEKKQDNINNKLYLMPSEEDGESCLKSEIVVGSLEDFTKGYRG